MIFLLQVLVLPYVVRLLEWLAWFAINLLQLVGYVLLFIFGVGYLIGLVITGVFDRLGNACGEYLVDGGEVLQRRVLRKLRDLR